MLVSGAVSYMDPRGFSFTQGLLAALVGLIAIDYFVTKTRRYMLPPGPTPLPILGSALAVIGRPLWVTFASLRKIYGDIYAVKVGGAEVIVVNAYKNVKQLLEGPTYGHRPEITWTSITQRRGIFSLDGDVHQKQNSVMRKILTKIEWDRSEPCTARCQQHAGELVQWLLETKGAPTDPLIYLDTTVCNNNTSVTIGVTFKPTDDLMKALSKISMDIFVDAGHQNVNNFLPMLRSMPGDPTRYKVLVNNAVTAMGVVQGVIESHKKALKEDPDPKDFIDHYIIAMENERQANGHPSFNEDQFVALVTDLVAMGIESTSATLRWIFLYLAENPDVQAKVHDEIRTVIGAAGPEMAHKNEMPYTSAVITETQRLANVVHIGLPHTCKTDQMFMGYRIPAGAIIIPNLASIHFDENTYPNPFTFKPDRHMDNGNFKEPREFMPFSHGSRTCPGVQLAKHEIFITLCTVLQHFKLSLADAPKDDVYGLVRYPGAYKLIFEAGRSLTSTEE